LIEPGRPQQNGRHERMHKTLEQQTTRPPAATSRGQQRRFDRFRHEFNEERPHEALGQKTPASPATVASAGRASESRCHTSSKASTSASKR
jgi:transposase InsO family protein